MMAKYRVRLETIASMTIKVEADNEADALDVALDEAPPDVCVQCGGWGQKWSLEIGQWDEPRNGDGTVLDSCVEKMEDE